MTEHDGDISIPLQNEVESGVSQVFADKEAASSEMHEALTDENSKDGDLGVSISSAGEGKISRTSKAEESENIFKSMSLREDDEADISAELDSASEHSISSAVGDFENADKNHSRHNSTSPQRYAVETSFTTGAQLETMESQPSSTHHLDYHVHMNRSRSTSETEEAGLDFVDINLGVIPDPVPGFSPYGAGAAAGASRSALEIRQDSISSNSTAAQNIAKAAEQRQSDRNSPFRRTVNGPVRRSVEGRYRGRTSQPSSRAPSPSHSPSPSPLKKQTVSRPNSSDDNGFMISVAGEDGEVSILPSTSIEAHHATIDSREDPADSSQSNEIDSERQKQEIDGGNSNLNGDGHAEAVSQGTGQASVVSANEKGYEVSEEQESAPTTQKDTNSPSDNDNGATESKKAPVLMDAADKTPDKKRRPSTHTPSMLEQHLSRTRMTTLPPKSKREDVKHLQDFEMMMKMSRDAEKKKIQEEEERRNQRDNELRESMKIWEKEILPSWTRARREARLRKVWWKGAPPSLRGRVWALACGNNQMLPRNLFTRARAEAQEGKKKGVFPKAELCAIGEDIASTLPSLRLYQKETGALYDDLYDVLCAFTIVRLDQGRASSANEDFSNSDSSTNTGYYPIGAASLAAMLLTNLTPSETLIALLNLIAERPWLRALYLHTSEPHNSNKPTSGFERVFDTLLADQMPKVYANMQARGVRPSAYVNDWIRTLFVPYLPFDAVARLWDCILLDEGDTLLFRIGIALVRLLSARLYVPEKEELITILRGNNRASIAVWSRFHNSATEASLSPSPRRRIDTEVDQSPTLSPSVSESSFEPQSNFAGQKHDSRELLKRDHALSVEAPQEMVPRDNIYGGQYGITETVLFQALEDQESWWKDSTLNRLLDREIVG